MSTTSAVTSAQSTGASTVANGLNNTLDKESFLKLLITEMQNQDPMSPMDNKDSIAQLAQFSSLEQMQNLNQALQGFGSTFANSSSATQAYTMAGKWIDYTDPNDSTKSLTGKVSGITFDNGTAKLKVGLSTIGLASVTNVYPTYESLGNVKAAAEAIGMLNKTVNYADPANPGNLSAGQVSGVIFVGGWPKLTIGSATVSPDSVVNGGSSTSSTDSTDVAAVANAMVGKWIKYADSKDPTKVLSGYVKSIQSDQGVPKLNVDGGLVDLGHVLQVYVPGG